MARAPRPGITCSDITGFKTGTIVNYAPTTSPQLDAILAGLSSSNIYITLLASGAYKLTASYTLTAPVCFQVCD